MHPIPLVDVKAQYAPFIPELKEAFSRALDSGRFIFGPEVEAFEREAAEYLGVEQALGVANGTDALVLALDALGIGEGDEVICPAFTFFATAEAIARRGATPVFADIDPETLNLAPAEVERAITPRTKAIVPVHLFGRPAPIAELRRFGLPLLEGSVELPYGLTEAAGPLEDGFVTWTEEPSPLPPETNQVNDQENQAHDQLRRRDAVVDQLGTYFATGEIVNTCSGACNCAEGACGELDPP